MEASKTFIARSIWATSMICLFALCAFRLAIGGEVGVDNIDKSKWAWVEGAGWLNLNPDGYGIVNKETYLEGAIWQESVGWISLGYLAPGDTLIDGHYANDHYRNWGVNRDPNTGKLSGFAWSENAGWINFDPCEKTALCSVSGVILHVIDGINSFDGWAWSENLGYIKFNPSETIDSSASLITDFNSVAVFPGLIRLTWKYSFDQEPFIGGFRILRDNLDQGQPTFSDRDIKFSVVGKGYKTGDTVVFEDTTGLPGGTSYLYKISAYDKNGMESKSLELPIYSRIFIDRQPPSPPPLNLEAFAISDTEIKVIWDDNTENKNGFWVYRSDPNVGSGEYFKVATISSGFDRNANSENRLSWLDTALTEGVIYSYKVRAYNTHYFTDFSNADTALLLARGALDPPSNFIVRPISETSILTQWTDNSDNETGFKLYRRKSGMGGYNFELLRTFTADIEEEKKGKIITWIDSDPSLENGVLYYYGVQAFNHSNESTSTISTLVGIQTDPLEKPGYVDAKPISEDSIKIEWEDSSNNEIGFRIYRIAGGAPAYQAYTLLEGINIKGTGGIYSWIDTYSDTDPHPQLDIPYIYQVCPYNAGNASGDQLDFSHCESDLAVINTGPGGLAPPVLTAYAENMTSIKLEWTDDSTAETGFKIYRNSELIYTFTKGVDQLGKNYKLSWTDSSPELQPDISYVYKVSVFNITDEIESNSYQIMISEKSMESPSDLTATAIAIKGFNEAEKSQIRLDWKDNSLEETGFIIYRSIDKGENFENLYTLTSDVISSGSMTWTDSGDDILGGLAKDVFYTYKVCSYNLGAEEKCSNTDYAIIKAEQVTAPIDIDGYALSKDPYKIMLHWTDNSTNEIGFKVYRSTIGCYDDSGWKVLYEEKNVDENGTGKRFSWIDTGADKGGLEGGAWTYIYKVMAYNLVDKRYSECETVLLQQSEFNMSTKIKVTAVFAENYLLKKDKNIIAYDRPVKEHDPVELGRVWNYCSLFPDCEECWYKADIQGTDDNRLMWNPREIIYPVLDTPEGWEYPPGGLDAYPYNPSKWFNEYLGCKEVFEGYVEKPKYNIIVEWEDNTTNETGFKIYRCSNSEICDDDDFIQVYTLTAGVQEAQKGYTLSWTDKGLIDDNGSKCTNILGNNCFTEDGLYAYKVTAYNLYNESDSEVDTTKLTAFGDGPPARPENLVAKTLSVDSIELNWSDASDNEIGFYIYKLFGRSDFTIKDQYYYDLTNGFDIHNTGVIKWTDSFSTPTNAGTYFYAVRSYNLNGVSDFSNHGMAVIAFGSLAAPTDLDARAISNTEIKLDWLDKSNNEHGFTIYRCDKAICSDSTDYIQIYTMTEGIDDLGTTERLFWTDSIYNQNFPIVQNTPYTYRVASFNFGGISDFSTDKAGIYNISEPVAPGELTVTPGLDYFELKWKDLSTNETGFNVYRKDDVSEVYSNVYILTKGVDETGKENDFIFTDTGGGGVFLRDGITYTYRVKAFNTRGLSPFSTEASGKLLKKGGVGTVLREPSDIEAYASIDDSNGMEFIAVEWTDMSDSESSFYVYRRNFSETEFKLIGEIPTTDMVGTNKRYQWKNYNDYGASIETVQPNVFYVYAVRSRDSNGNLSNFSNTDTAQINTTPFEDSMAPSHLDAKVLASNKILIEWTDNSPLESAFIVYKSETGEPRDWEPVMTIVKGLDGGGQGKRISWLHEAEFNKEIDHWYKVRAVNSASQSNDSNYACAKIKEGAFEEYEIPTGLTAAIKSFSEIELNWFYTPGKENGFIIYRREHIGFDPYYTLALGHNIDPEFGEYKVSWTDSGLEPNTEYSYRVSAYNVTNESDLSKIVTARTPLETPLVLTYPEDITVRKNKFGEKVIVVSQGQEVQFGTADNTPSEWTVNECFECINSDGLFTAPDTAGFYKLNARSDRNPSRSAFLLIVVPLKVEVESNVYRFDETLWANVSINAKVEGSKDSMKTIWSLVETSEPDLNDRMTIKESWDHGKIFLPESNKNNVSFKIKVQIKDADDLLTGISDVVYVFPLRYFKITITKAENGLPVKDATVSVVGFSISEKSNENGVCGISIIDAFNNIKEYTLKIEKQGFLTKLEKITSPENCNFVLEEKENLVMGYVKMPEPENDPIAQALVISHYLEDGQRKYIGPVETDADGRYDIHCPINTQCTIRAWKKGYMPAIATCKDVLIADELILNKTINFDLRASYDVTKKDFRVFVASDPGFGGEKDECVLNMSQLNRNDIINASKFDVGSYTSDIKKYTFNYSTVEGNDLVGFTIKAKNIYQHGPHKDPLEKDAAFYFYLGKNNYVAKSSQIDKYMGGTIEDSTGTVKCFFPLNFTTKLDEQESNYIISYIKNTADIKVLNYNGTNVDVKEAMITLPCPSNLNIFDPRVGIYYQSKEEGVWKNGIKDKTIKLVSITPESGNSGLLVSFLSKHLTRFKISYPEAGGYLEDGEDLSTGCFIATAAYGDKLNPNVRILSKFRDIYLLTNKAGRAFVNTYYKYSPIPAKVISENSALRVAVRLILAPFVGISFIAVKTTLLQKIILLAFIAAAGLLIIRRRRIASIRKQ